MCSLFCEHFCPEAFPYLNRKFIKRRYSGNEGDTGRSGNPEIELFSNPLIRNISYPMRQAGRTVYVRFCFRRVRTQESFGQRLGDETAPPQFFFKKTLPKKAGEKRRLQSYPIL